VVTTSASIGWWPEPVDRLPPDEKGRACTRPRARAALLGEAVEQLDDRAAGGDLVVEDDRPLAPTSPTIESITTRSSASRCLCPPRRHAEAAELVAVLAFRVGETDDASRGPGQEVLGRCRGGELVDRDEKNRAPAGRAASS
jgi:hypothetical protein